MSDQATRCAATPIFAGMSAAQLRIVALCVAINMLDGFDILSMAFVAPALGRAWALAPQTIGLLLSAGLAGMMAGSIVVGLLADRFGRRPIVLACLIVASAGMMGSALSTGVPYLVAARLCTGMAIGGMLPCLNTLVAESVRRESRTMAIALMQAGFPIGATLGGFASVGLLGAFGWPAVFGAGAMFTSLLIPLVWLHLPEPPAYVAAHAAASSSPHQPHRGTRLREHRYALLLAFTTFFCCVFSFYFLASWMPKVLVDAGLSEGQSVAGGALLTAGGMIAALVVGGLSLRRALTPIVVTVALGSAVATAVFGLVAGGSLLITLLAAFLLGLLTNCTQIGVYATLPSLFPTPIRAGASGLAMGAGRLGSVLGPFVAGVLLGEGVGQPMLFAIMAVPYAVAGLLLGLGRGAQRF